MKRSIPKIILFLLAIDLALAFLFVANFALGQPLGVVNSLLDLNGELSFATWYSSVKLFMVGAALGWLAVEEPALAKTALYALLASVFIGLSADEIVQLHEYLGSKSDLLLPGGTRENTAFSTTGIWMFAIGLPAVSAIALLFWYARKLLAMPLAAFAKCLAGLAIFAVGAMGMEALGNFIAGAALGFAQITAEELLEMAGITVVFWGALDWLRACNVSLQLGQPAAQRNFTQPAFSEMPELARRNLAAGEGKAALR